MTSPGIELENTAELKAAAHALEARGFARDAGRIVAKGLRKMANAGRREIRAAMRPHRRTGKMAGKVRAWFDGYGMDTTATVKAGGSVVHLIVAGTAPHELRPVRARAMTIRAPGRAGAVVAVRRGPIRHPGTRPDPVVERGIEAAMPELGRLMDATVIELRDRLDWRRGRV